MTEFKPGDRVRYRKGRPQGDSAYNGELGTVRGFTAPGHTEVDWDNRKPGRFIPDNPFNENLELLTAMIDTTKPLLVTGSIGGPRPVEFITETSEGHILTGAPEAKPGWLIFDKQGKWVRSNDGTGRALALSNPPSRFVGYQRIVGTDKPYVLASVYKTAGDAILGGDTNAVLRVTSENGKVVDVTLIDR